MPKTSELGLAFRKALLSTDPDANEDQRAGEAFEKVFAMLQELTVADGWVSLDINGLRWQE